MEIGSAMFIAVCLSYSRDTALPAKGCVRVGACGSKETPLTLGLGIWTSGQAGAPEERSKLCPSSTSREGSASPPPQHDAGLSVGIPTSEALAEADLLPHASACPAAHAEYR